MKISRVICTAAAVMIAISAVTLTAFAAPGNVAGAIEGTWTAASGQIKTVVNNVVFPIIDLILAVFFFRISITANRDTSSGPRPLYFSHV